MWTRRRVLAAGTALGAAALLPTGRSFAATDQLRVALSHEPPHLDPTVGEDPATLAVSYQNIFEGLTRIDEAGKVQPCLAKSWSVSADKLSYSFVLEPEVRYHDGTSFDAGHVVFSLKRLIGDDGQSPRKALYQSIAEVTAAADGSVALTLKQADDKLLYNLGLADAVMVAPESAANNRAQPIGTGPFDLIEWDNGKGIILERNEDYWGVHPLTTQANFYFIADTAAAIASLGDGGIDGYPDFPAPDALAPLKDSPAFKITNGKGPDGKPRIGIWNAQLTGMWVDAPVEACVLHDIHWASETSPPQVGPAPFITNPD
jgi:peptide/nickel transport system substrate-binding protein